MSAACFQTSSGDLGRQSPPFHVRESNDAGSSERWQGPAKKRLDAAFICPAAGCGRRVAILYGGGNFACRHCYQTRDKASGQASGAAGLGAGHTERRGREAEVDALAHIRAAGDEA
jgi:hypothetical protein